jgi:cytochrome c-type biogenesis protein CcmE
VSKTFISIIVVAIAVAGLMVFQATRQTRSLVLTPTEVMALAKSQGALPRIRVGARVSAAAIDYQVEPSIQLKFSVGDPGVRNEAGQHIAADPAPKAGPILSVIYNGLRPDMFEAGRDVLIDGDFHDGVLHAQKLLTQCPSKYEPPSPVTQYSSPRGGTVQK